MRRNEMSPLAESLELVGICFDGSGRAHGQAAAPARLRAAGLSTVVPAARLTPDIIVSEPDPGRGPKAGFVNERALLEMVEATYARVCSALQDDRFPLLYGGDCSVLLGAIPAVRDTYGNAGLLFVDGHEDATTLEGSTTGEAANMEIALLLGMTGEHATEPIRMRMPALDPDAIVMLGQRDENYRREIGVPSIGDQVRIHNADEVRRDPERLATHAAALLSNRAAAWWLLTWSALTAITQAALRNDRCRGWSIGVYNADLDPDLQDAQRILAYLADTTTNAMISAE